MTLDPQSLSILMAAAVRLAYRIGLHRTLDEFALNQSEIDQRRNVFWTVYIIDKYIALRCGQPSAIVDNDIGINLPTSRAKYHREVSRRNSKIRTLPLPGAAGVSRESHIY